MIINSLECKIEICMSSTVSSETNIVSVINQLSLVNNIIMLMSLYYPAETPSSLLHSQCHFFALMLTPLMASLLLAEL